MDPRLRRPVLQCRHQCRQAGVARLLHGLEQVGEEAADRDGLHRVTRSAALATRLRHVVQTGGLLFRQI